MADSALDKSCSTCLATSPIASTVRAAVTASPRDGHGDPDSVEASLGAQRAAGLDSRLSPHSGKGLASEHILRAYAARHLAVDKAMPLSKIANKDLKKVQPGKN